jgi:hypothetical protein
MTAKIQTAPPAEQPAHEDEFDLRWAINRHLDAHLNEEARCYPSNAMPTELACYLHDAEEALAEDFRLHSNRPVTMWNSDCHMTVDTRGGV